MLAVRLPGGERLTPVAAALAVAAGVVAGNFFRDAMPWQLDRDRPLNGRDMVTVLGWSLEGKPEAGDAEPTAEPVEEPPRMPPSRYWLPWLAGLAVVVELLTRLPRVPSSPAWVV